MGARRRGIALFPGGFKPPHRSHIEAIAYLAAQPGVDEVLLLVSDRARLVPGSHLALDGRSSVRALQWLLRRCLPRASVRIVLSRHRAMDYARELAQATPGGTTLWFCLGEKDQLQGDERFADLEALQNTTAARLEPLVVPRLPNEVRATDVRALLLHSDGAARIQDLLPAGLNAAAKRAYWQFCRDALQPMAAIVEAKIRARLQGDEFTDNQRLEPLDPTSPDPVFQFTTAKGETCRVLYAGDTVVEGSFVDPTQPLPKRRFAVERRVLLRLAACPELPFRWPRIQLWDAQQRLVVQAQPAGRTIAQWLSQPNEQPGKMFYAMGHSLAALHEAPIQHKPLWGCAVEDEARWAECVFLLPQALRTTPVVRSVLVHTRLSLEVLYWDGQCLSFSDFTGASCVGDPAYDLAMLVGQLRQAGVNDACIETMLQSYWNGLRAGSQAQDGTRIQRAAQLSTAFDGRRWF